MNYINNFNIGTSTYLCTPVITSGSNNTYLYTGTVYPSDRFPYSEDSITNNCAFSGSLRYFSEFSEYSSRTYTRTVGDVVTTYFEENYPGNINLSVNSNFMLNGKADLFTNITSSSYVIYSTTTSIISSSVYHHMGLSFDNNVIIGGSVVIPNVDTSSQYSVHDNVVIAAVVSLLPNSAPQSVIIKGGANSMSTFDGSSYLSLDPPSNSATFIGGGTLTQNTSSHSLFIGGNNFYYSKQLTVGTDPVVIEDIGFIISGSSVSSSYPDPSEYLRYVYSYDPVRHTISFSRASGYYAITNSNDRAYCYKFLNYFNAWGSTCDACSSYFVAVKPTLYEISLVIGNSEYNYGRWCGGIGCGFSPNYVIYSHSMVQPVSVSESLATLKALNYMRDIYMELSSGYVGSGTYALLHANAADMQGPIIGFVEPLAPATYSYTRDVFSRSSYVLDDKGTTEYYWTYENTITAGGGVYEYSFSYISHPKLVIANTDVSRTLDVTLYIHKMTTNDDI